jgi:hypothetical protein
MKHFDATIDKSAFPKLHESTLQDIRHERRTEDLRLEGLKKALQIKLQAQQSEATQAA